MEQIDELDLKLKKLIKSEILYTKRDITTMKKLKYMETYL